MTILKLYGPNLKGRLPKNKRGTYVPLSLDTCTPPSFKKFMKEYYL